MLLTDRSLRCLTIGDARIPIQGLYWGKIKFPEASTKWCPKDAQRYDYLRILKTSSNMHEYVQLSFRIKLHQTQREKTAIYITRYFRRYFRFYMGAHGAQFFLKKSWRPFLVIAHIFWHIWGPQNTSAGRGNSVTLLNTANPTCTSQLSQFFSVKNSLNRRLGLCPPPAGYAPTLICILIKHVIQQINSETFRHNILSLLTTVNILT